ncbi:MAG: beta-ketoacyl-ACP synthase II [Planctomycetota bacterium]
MRRVVVTGIGVVTPLGIGKAPNWEGVTTGRSGIGPITLFDPVRHDTKIAGEIKGLVPENYMEAKEVKRNDRFLHLAMAAAWEALEEAGMAKGVPDPERVAVMYGVGIGGMLSFETQVQRLLEKGPGRISPFLIPQLITDTAAGFISIVYGFKGPNFDITSACASGAHAIGESYRAIKFGVCDAAVTGGVEAAVTPMGVAGFNALKALSTENDLGPGASRPFDLNRSGFVIAEGGAVLVLEELERARARGIPIYAEITGYGATGDAFHVTAPCADGDGAMRAMKVAMAEAHLGPADIHYINAHGTSTKYNDRTETIAVKRAFGAQAARIPMSSTKGCTGHMLGGTGAVEAYFAIQAIRTGIIPPTINYETPDPECDLDCVPNTPRTARVVNAMSNNFGFGGHNASLIFSAI